MNDPFEQIKAYYRYSCIRRLLEKLRNISKIIKIVIADDTPEEFREEISGKNIFQINLPDDSGWFAGRGVALAMVETEYFFWLDDDFDILADQTNIFSDLFEIIDKSGFDIIGGVTQE